MYRAPVEEIAFTLKEVAGLRAAVEEGKFGDLSLDLADAILAEAGRFATEEVAPLYKAATGRAQCLKDAAVIMPPGWKELYRRWIDGGWNSLVGSGRIRRAGPAAPCSPSRRSRCGTPASMAFAPRRRR